MSSPSKPAEGPPDSIALTNWLTRRRVAISLIAFSLLLACNIVVLKTPPQDVFDWTQAGTLVGMGIVFIGLAVRTWAAGTLHKSAEITRSGPYALVRNPLYVGSFLMMLGFTVLLHDIPSLIFIVGPLAAIYWLTVCAEERNLAGSFPDDWNAYARRVPRFLPRLYSKDFRGGWSFAQWHKNREYQAVIATLIGMLGVFYWRSLW